MSHRDLLQSNVLHKLRSLRSSLRIRLALEGVSWLIVVAVGAMFVSLALDYMLRLDRPIRATILLSAAVGGAYLLYRWLARPLTAPMSSDALALLVEGRFPELGDRLISALQFSRRSDLQADGVSAAMITHMAREANRMAEPLDFKRIVERQTLLHAMGGAGVVLAVSVLFVAVAPATASLWARRNVLLERVDWPQKTYLVVTGADENGDFTVVRGEDLRVVVELGPDSKVAPDHVIFHAQYETIGSTESSVDGTVVDVDGKPVRRYVKVFEAVTRDLEEFYVTGGDDRRDARRPHRVHVIDPPELEQISFLLNHPPYQRREPVPLDASVAVLGVPVGGRIEVEAIATKPLSAARILLDGEVASEMKVLDYTGPDGQRSPRKIKGVFLVEGLNVPESHAMRFALTDVEGYVSRRGQRYEIRTQPDMPPSVDLKKSEVQSTITPTAQIPLRVAVKDDHGVAGAWFAVRLADANDRVRVGEPIRPGSGTRRLLEEATILDLAAVSAVSLEPGDLMQLIAEAEDTFPDGPNAGRSAPLNFKIVSPEELLAQLVQRMKNVSESLDQAIVQHGDATGKTAAVAEALRTGPIVPDIRRLLQESATIETSVASEMAKAADQLEVIYKEMQRNRVGSQDMRRVLSEDVIVPLRALSDPLRQVVAALNGTRNVDDAPTLGRQAGEINVQQERIGVIMGAISEKLIKNADRIQMAKDVKEIMEAVRSIGKGIEEVIDEQLKGLGEPEDDSDD
jgi:hypothetical protein